MIKVVYLDEDRGWHSTFYYAFSGMYEVAIPDVLPHDVTEIWEIVRDAQVVITDFRLNGDGVVSYTGDDVAREVHAHNMHLPIFVITSYEDNAIQTCRQVQIIRGKEMFTEPEQKVKLCHMIDAAVNVYEDKKTAFENKLVAINDKIASGSHLTPKEDADRFEAELYLSELNLDDSVRAQLITKESSSSFQEVLDIARSLVAKHQ